MFFLSPLALLGLAAALVPPLLHLFQRRRPPDVVFPAVRYLRQTTREAQRSIRLKHLLLMLLRVVAVVLLVLAAARPVVRSSGRGLHEPTAVALIVDNSLSSAAVVGGTRVLDELKARANETLGDAAAGDALWLVGADGIARRGSAAELRRAVGALEPDARRLDLAAAIRSAARLVRGSGYVRGEVHLLSDLQATGFDSAAADSSAAGLA
ncbi:MAG TPA: BatA domain-containing protein, partial [Gemmatimonadales bacterium]|nr:BatA domain-containing protein [Gemmatimonadales bacterium]